MSSRIRYLRAEDIHEVIYWEAPHLEEEIPLEEELTEKFLEDPDVDKDLLIRENHFKEEKL